MQIETCGYTAMPGLAIFLRLRKWMIILVVDADRFPDLLPLSIPSARVISRWKSVNLESNDG
jgi:hypothetical protein